MEISYHLADFPAFICSFNICYETQIRIQNHENKSQLSSSHLALSPLPPLYFRPAKALGSNLMDYYNEDHNDDCNGDVRR